MSDKDPPPPFTLTATDPAKILVGALADPRVPKIYGNQFFTVVGAHDLGIMVGLNGVPTGIVSISYPLAKTLAAGLAEAIAGYEKGIKASVTDAGTLEQLMVAANKSTGGS